MHMSLSFAVLVLAHYLSDLAAAQSQYAAIPRWGQAVALVQDVLYIHGGRTDPYNSFSYTSAPVSNDLLSLSLTSAFNPSSPSFTYIGGCSNCSAAQGPAVAWHTLTPFNTSGLLLFGGATDPNTSPRILPDASDSATLLIVNPTSSDSTWTFETQSWASEPMRRIHHTAVSSAGKIWIVGGEKADDSGSAFSEHYLFDPTVPSFTELPTANGPPDITGHQSVVLTDGRLLVFGGYNPSGNSLIPFDTIWILDTTQTNPSWSSATVSNASLPTPRRAFAATLVDSGKVLIQGGSDAELQNNVADGWILDTTQNPMSWSNISALSQLGQRRDHFAVGLGTMVIFGFGYAENSPASASLEVFDVSSGSFQTTYTPPAAVTSPTATTLPLPGQTSPPEFTPGSAEYPLPSHTHSSGSAPGNTTGTNPKGSPLPDSDDSSGHVAVIALGTVFGVLGLAAGTAVVTWYLKRRHSQDSFHRLGASGETGEDDSPTSLSHNSLIHMAGPPPLVPVVRTVKDRLSRVVPGLHPTQTVDRRDMLADEDSGEFGAWYAVRRDPSGSASSRMSVRRPALERIYDSLSSLRSAGGAVLEYAASVTARSARREGSTTSKNSIWRGQSQEKQRSFDPYADDRGLIQPRQYAAPTLVASRRQASSYTYVDPFEDYDVESLKYDPDVLYRDESSDDDPEHSRGYPSLRDPPPRTKLQSPGTFDLTRLTPVSERLSIPTLTDPSSASDTSLSIPLFAVPSNGTSSSGSHEPQSPASPRRPSSIIDANPPVAQQMRRSNSWWTRFAKAPLLERARSSDSGKAHRPLDFRDPNPVPRLVTIEESMQSNSPDSPVGKKRSGGSTGPHHRQYSTLHHGRSASSLQTARTADSETLERMAHTMQVVHKGSSASSRRSGASEAEAEGPAQPSTGRPLSVVMDSRSQALDDSSTDAFVQSPAEMSHQEASMQALLLGDSPPRSPVRASPPESPGRVAERVQAYERRMSLHQEDNVIARPPGLPSRTRTSGYGLAPKQPLFVANPDHRHGSSSDS